MKSQNLLHTLNRYGAISLINEYGEIISDSFFQTDKSIPYYVGKFEKESFINLKKNIDKLNLQIEKYYFLQVKGGI